MKSSNFLIFFIFFNVLNSANININKIFIYNKPKINSKYLFTLKKGDSFEILGKSKESYIINKHYGKWTKIKFKKRRGTF